MTCWLLLLGAGNLLRSEVHCVATLNCEVNIRTAKHKKFFFLDTCFGFSFACIAEGQILEIPSSNHTKFSLSLVKAGK